MRQETDTWQEIDRGGTATAAGGWLAGGLACHRDGRLAEAESLYRRVLAREPGNADALHLCGMAAWSGGRTQEALSLLAAAIRARPDVAPFHNNLGMVLEALGRHQQACLCFTQALALAPGMAEAHLNFGNALQSLGLLEEAVTHYRAALAGRPGLAEAHNNLGNALTAQGRLEEAEQTFGEALRLKPDYAEAWLNLSGTLKRQGRLQEGIECCRRAIRLAPGMAEAFSNLAAILSEAEYLANAESAAREALARKPGLAEPYVTLSRIRQAQKLYPESEAFARRALEMAPASAAAWNNLGNAVEEQGRMEEAEACYRAALEHDPSLADAHYNLANQFRAKARLAEARESYDHAIRLRPAYVKAHWNLALTLLAAGEWERGWEEFEWRWRKPDTPPRPFRQPLWDGTPLEGRTILLHAEQGLGDTIQFVRYAEDVRQAGGRVMLECPGKLVGLLAGAAGVDSAAEAGGPLPEFDVHAPLLSLPRIFRTTPHRVPARVPYLDVEAGYRAKWRARLAEYAGPRVGLVWKGNPEHAEDRFRSMDLDALAPLGAIPAVTWFSLQHGAPAARLGGAPMTDLGPETEDFRDAAAALEQLDLLISVDTSLAHLAGALARPVWLLGAFLPDWRWMLDRPDTPWYPTLRLFRQPERGAWAAVAEQVARALRDGLSKRGELHRYAW